MINEKILQFGICNAYGMYRENIVIIIIIVIIIMYTFM